MRFAGFSLLFVLLCFMLVFCCWVFSVGCLCCFGVRCGCSGVLDVVVDVF